MTGNSPLLLALVCALAAVGYVLSRRAGTGRRPAIAIAVAAPSLWFATPFELRFALTTPALTDEPLDQRGHH